MRPYEPAEAAALADEINDLATLGDRFVMIGKTLIDYATVRRQCAP